MRSRKEMDSAMRLYEESLSMRRHLLKSSHPLIADCLVGMAETLRHENKYVYTWIREYVNMWICGYV